MPKRVRPLVHYGKPVFRDSHLSLRTKRKMYKVVVLRVLLYGSETWATKRDAVQRLEVFHHGCLKGILEITTAQQRTKDLSSVQIAKHFGMGESLGFDHSQWRLRC